MPELNIEQEVILPKMGGIVCGKKDKAHLLLKDKTKSPDFVEYVYKPVLLDFMNSCEDAVLMEDNAPISTANWRDEHSIQKLQWSAQLDTEVQFFQLFLQVTVQYQKRNTSLTLATN
ncbi:hypothetical protein G6F56_001700 [Rhizopus delemar]|nr:hypothetical protein G6F56_001700 [Rhizopus delemar]